MLILVRDTLIRNSRDIVVARVKAFSDDLGIAVSHLGSSLWLNMGQERLYPFITRRVRVSCLKQARKSNLPRAHLGRGHP